MPSSVLDSLFAVLERRSADERLRVSDIGEPSEVIVACIVARSLSR